MYPLENGGRRALLLISLFPIWILGGCTQYPEAPSAFRSVATPAAAGSGMSDLNVGADGRLYLSWIEPAGEDLHAARFATWEGNAWSEARTIFTGDNLFVNWADFPSVTALADGTLAAHWLGKVGPDTYAYAVHLVVSRDGGRSWSPPVLPHQDGTQTEHGFVSMLPVSSDSFELVWLDGRETAMEKGQAGFAVHPEGAMTLRHALLSREGKAGPDRLVDDRVCDCCPTDAIQTADGSLIVVYRDRTENEIRDISIRRWDGKTWSEASEVYRDRWEIEGCPVNGPALAAAGDKVAVAWFTMAGDEPKVQLARSSDGARSFGPPIRVDGGRPVGRVDLTLLQDGTALVTWIEESGDSSAEIRLRRVDSSGHLHPPRLLTPVSASRGSGMPRMARLGEQVFLTWTLAEDPPRIQTVILPVSAGT